MSYELSSDAERIRRVGLLAEPHVEPLTRYVRRLRRTLPIRGLVPDFDPVDGGVTAPVLFLLEAPGPNALKTGFVSRDNPDLTARNMGLLLAQSGLRRQETLLWNVVPWYVGDGDRIRPVRRSDTVQAFVHLARLLQLLPNLKAVVLVGRKAQMVEEAVASVVQATIFKTYHPSQRVFNAYPDARRQIIRVYKRVARFVR